MKIFYLIFLVIIFSSCQNESKKISDNTVSENKKINEILKPELDLIKTKKKAEEALVFCKSKKLNTDICILIDMSLHSGLNRFVIWDFKEQKVVNKYLVGHGCGSNSWSSDESKDKPIQAYINNGYNQNSNLNSGVDIRV